MPRSLQGQLQRPAVRAGLAVFAAGLLLTGGAAWRAAHEDRHQSQHALERRTERLGIEVARRVQHLRATLGSTRAAHQALGSFDAWRFRDFIGSLQAEDALPGLRGVGYVQRVERAHLAAYEEEVRRGQPGFQVGGEGAADVLYPIRFLEPHAINNNASLLGSDLGFEARRRAAIEHAVDSGEATISAPIEFRRDARSIGWLMFVPVYRPGLPVATTEQRREALEGLFYARIGVADLLGGLTDPGEGLLQFRLHDGEDARGRFLYDSRGAEAAALPAQAVRARTSLDVGGRRLALSTWTTHAAGDGHGASPNSIALVGLALSLLAALATTRVLSQREAHRSRTERESAERRRAEELMHLTDVVAIGLDERLRVRWINPGFALLTGWTDDDCVGRPAGRLLHSPQGQLLLSQAADRLRHGAAGTQLQLMHKARNGGTIWLDASLQLEGLEAGFVLRAVDITARRLAEERLAESEHLLRMVIDNVPASLAYWGMDERLRLANRGFADTVYRGANGNVIGASLREVLGDDVHAQLRPRIDRVLQGEAQHFEWSMRRRDGSQRVLLVHLEPDWSGGQVAGAFSMGLDISELKQAQEEAQRGSEAKTQFLSHMSHEIRTPLNAVIGMLALLRATRLDGRQADYANKAEGAARSLLGLLNDILDLTKIEAGRMVLDPAPFRPDVLLDDLASILAGAAQGKGLALDFALDPSLPQVLVGDDLRLRQVLVNLGGNAVKFTRAGHVAVRMRSLGRDGDLVRVGVSVEDTGIGIAPDEQARIFTDFSQASASTTRQFGGTGLGLGICRRLVAMMGGDLLLDSEPGRGSRFHFELRLPVAPESAAVPLPRQTESAPLDGGPPLAGLRLLVVEDNPVNQQVARELLAGEGANVTLASDGAEGVRCLQAAPGGFDAVLMDMQMPVMDGCSAAREIRGRLGDQRTPIIAMTANAMASDRERCLAAGMNDHVAKPFELHELVAVVRRHCAAALGRPVPHEEAEDEPMLDFDLPAAPAAPAAPVTPAAAAIARAPEPREASAAIVSAPATAAPAASGEAAFWDRTVALQRTGGNAKVLEKVLPVFRRNLLEMERQLRDLAAGTAPAAGPEALFHTLKGMAGTLGADELSRRAAQAEMAVRGGGSGVLLATDVHEAVEGTLAALDAAG